MSPKKAIVTGISGQDGYFISRELLKRGYQVIGTTRSQENLKTGSIVIERTNYSLSHLKNLISKYAPDEIYHFAGQSFVGKSWNLCEETLLGNALTTTNLLDAIKSFSNIKFFNASSSEIYEDKKSPLHEVDPKSPLNPYGCSKLYSFNLVQAFRESYGLYAVNGIFFNHESEKRSPDFFSQKLIQGIIDIHIKKTSEIRLGNLNAIRDWGDAEEYMSVVPDLLNLKDAGDFNICTGVGKKASDLATFAFSLLGLEPKDYIHIDQNLVRNKEKEIIVGCNDKIHLATGWKPQRSIEDVLRRMISSALKERGLNEVSIH